MNIPLILAHIWCEVSNISHHFSRWLTFYLHLGWESKCIIYWLTSCNRATGDDRIATFSNIPRFSLAAIGVAMPLDSNMKNSEHFIGYPGAMNLNHGSYCYILSFGRIFEILEIRWANQRQHNFVFSGGGSVSYWILSCEIVTSSTIFLDIL